MDESTSERCLIVGFSMVQSSGKQTRVVVDRSFHKCSYAWDDNGYLVGDGSNELLGIATQGVGTEEEEACEE